MPFDDTAMIVAADALRGVVTHLQLHTADTNAAGTTNVSSAPRQPVTWGAATGDGDFSNSADVDFTGGESSGPVTHVTAWSAATDGIKYGKWPIASGDTSFNAAGEYHIEAGAFTLNGSSPE